LQKKTKEGDSVGIWVTYLILITGLSIDKQKLPVPNNSLYAMRVSEVLQVQIKQARFVSVNTDIAMQSRTADNCDR
jgi:hypothetical protein